MASLKVKNKKQLLTELAARVAPMAGVPEREIFDVLLQRERLGSTGLGNGVGSTSSRSTVSRSTSCFCCLRPKAPVRIT